MPRKRVFPSVRLLRPLACVLGAGLLFASFARATPLTQTIGYDPINPQHNPSEYKASMDMALTNDTAFYVPFSFDFGGGLYSLDSIQWLLRLGSGDVSFISLLVTSTLGTDLTLPSALATFSATGSESDPAVFTFHADSPFLLTSGSTYYLRIAYTGAGEPQWVSNRWLSGAPPAQGSNPTASGGPSGGPDVTLTPLMTLNPGPLTFRMVGQSDYTDVSDVYGISMTATAVPEPAAFALVMVGSTLGAGFLFRLRRRS